MPTNRTRRTRNIKKPAIDPAEIYFLQHGSSKNGPPHEHLKWDLFMRGTRGERWKPIWEEVREEVMATWIKKHPGTRPWAWWEIDAFFDGKLLEPRKRLGGIGTPDFETLNIVPTFDKGIPDGWVSKFDVEYYGPDFKGKAIDPEDPPVYESEAAYLERHGLLTASEKKWLAGHPKAMEPERIGASVS